MELILDLKNLKKFCEELALDLRAPHLVTLEGPLGSGKTQVTSFLVEALTQKKPAHSPTFSVINKYDSWIFPIYHVDLYRMENMEDLNSTGFWDLFEQNCLLIIEWSNLLDDSVFPISWDRTSIVIDLLENKPLHRRVSVRATRTGGTFETR